MFKQPLYLVPFDFSEVSNKSLNLSIELAKINDGSVYLLHVSKKDSDKSAAKNKFEELEKNLTEEQQALVSTKVITGNLYDDIGKAGEILKATMIIMGTHGAQGLQKIFGSNALKIVNHSSTPLLILQDDSNLDKIKTIVMPFSFDKESIQIAKFAGSIAKQFKAKIHLVGIKSKDEFLATKAKTNQLIVRDLLAKNAVDFEVVALPQKESFELELIKYAKDVDADIISAAHYTRKGGMPTLKNFVQQLIENEHGIPFLTVNAEEISAKNSQYSFMR